MEWTFPVMIVEPGFCARTLTYMGPLGWLRNAYAEGLSLSLGVMTPSVDSVGVDARQAPLPEVPAPGEPWCGDHVSPNVERAEREKEAQVACR